MTSRDKFIQEDLRTSQGTEGSFLIVKKIYDTMIPEVEKALIPRQLAAIVFGPGDIPGSSVDVNLEEVNSMKVRLIGEGSEIFLSDPEFTSFNLKPVKYGLRTNITKEMLEDGKWNLLQRAQSIAGKRFAENETSLIFSQSLDNAGNTVSGGAAVTVANITRAMQYLEDNDYQPTDMLLGPEVVYDIRNIDTFVEADKLGSREMLERGFIGSIYGMRLWRFSANAAPSTTYSKYAYVIDKDYAFVIAEKRPLTVETYNLPQSDTHGIAITHRFVSRYLRANAIAKITSS